MSGLAATILQSAISRFQADDTPGSAFCIWAARGLGEDQACRDVIAAFRSQIFDRIESAQQRGDFDLALRLDGLIAIFDPDSRLRVARDVTLRRAAARCLDAERALLREEPEAAAGFALAALALDPDNEAAQRHLKAVAQRLIARYRSLAQGAPSLEGTLALSFGVALGAQDQRRDLLTLLYGLGDFATVIVLCQRIEADARAGFEERLEALRLRLQAEHRSLGADQAQAEALAAADVRAWLMALGPSPELEDAALRNRVASCFGIDGYRQVLADLRELQRRHPEDEWVAYNLCVILFNALHPDVKASADLVVRQAGNRLAYLKPAYTMMAMIGATNQALTMAARLAAHHPEFAVFSALHQMATDLEARPIKVFGRARQGRRLLYANLVCWGEAYIELMEQASIASLLAPGNIPALVEHVDLVIELFTMPADLPRLLDSAALQRLGDYCEIRIHLFPESVAAQKKAWGYEIYGYALHATALRAERDGADVTFLMPDILYADGAYGLIGQKATSGRRAIFVDSLNTYAAPMLDRMRPFRQGDALIVSPADLIDAAMGCLSKRTLHSLYQPGDRQACAQPTRVIFPLESGLRTHAFIMTPIYVSHAALAPFIMRNFRTHDGLMSEHVLNRVDDEELEVLSATEFCYVEVCENDGLLSPIVDGDVASTIRKFFVNFGLGRNRIRLFERPIDFPTRSPPDLPLVSAEEAAARVRDIQQMFATDPLLVDVAEEQERLRAALYS